LPRVQVYLDELEKTLDYLDKSGSRYVSDGNPNVVARKAGGTTADSAHRRTSHP
jgi:hypothetical protein